MIIGLGIDTLEIERFAQWHNRPYAQLSRIFSVDEIAYCQANPLLSAQRFAVRFAAREALFKAMSQADPANTIPFMTLCRATAIAKNEKGAPYITLSKDLLAPSICQGALDHIQIMLSLTHSQKLASAIVILQKSQNNGLFV